MVCCCVPFCKSKSGKSKGISFHDFPSDFHLQQKWLKIISRDNFSPNTNSFSQGVCSLHFQPSDYKPGLKRRCLKPLAVPSIFLQYPSYNAQNVETPRKCIERKTLASKRTIKIENSEFMDSSPVIENECLNNLSLSSPCENSLEHLSSKPIKTENFEFVNSSLVIENECLSNLSLPPSSSENLLEPLTSKSTVKIESFEFVDSSPVIENEYLSNLSLTPSENLLEPLTSKLTIKAENSEFMNSSTVIANKYLNNLSPSVGLSEKLLSNSYSQTTLDIDKELFVLKRQNSALQAKVYRSDKKLAKLQSCLHSAEKKLNKYKKNNNYKALNKIINAAVKKNDSAIMLMEQILNFNKKIPN